MILNIVLLFKIIDLQISTFAIYISKYCRDCKILTICDNCFCLTGPLQSLSLVRENLKRFLRRIPVDISGIKAVKDNIKSQIKDRYQITKPCCSLTDVTLSQSHKNKFFKILIFCSKFIQKVFTIGVINNQQAMPSMVFKEET